MDLARDAVIVTEERHKVVDVLRPELVCAPGSERYSVVSERVENARLTRQLLRSGFPFVEYAVYFSLSLGRQRLLAWFGANWSVFDRTRLRRQELFEGRFKRYLACGLLLSLRFLGLYYGCGRGRRLLGLGNLRFFRCLAYSFGYHECLLVRWAISPGPTRRHVCAVDYPTALWFTNN